MPILKKMYEWPLLRVLTPTSCQKNVKWFIKPLYKNKVIFAFVSVDQVLMFDENNVKNYKQSDLLSRRASITGRNIKS